MSTTAPPGKVCNASPLAKDLARRVAAGTGPGMPKHGHTHVRAFNGMIAFNGGDRVAGLSGGDRVAGAQQNTTTVRALTGR